MGRSGIVGSRRHPLVFGDRSQAELRDKRAITPVSPERRQAAVQYAIQRLSNEGGRKLNGQLALIFAMQKALDGRITAERGVEKTLDEWVVGITLAMESEIDEIRREVNWKWWKNPKPIDTAALQGEVIDMWHFLVSLSDKVGLTADDVYRIYCEKNAENHARQSGDSEKEGYEVNV